MAMTEVIGAESAVTEPMPGKCPDCFGTGAVLDDDGSFTGVVGQPMACTCMGFSRCKVMTHPAGCDCYERMLDEWRPEGWKPPVRYELRPRRGPSHWWGE